MSDSVHFVDKHSHSHHFPDPDRALVDRSRLLSVYCSLWSIYLRSEDKNPNLLSEISALNEILDISETEHTQIFENWTHAKRDTNKPRFCSPFCKKFCLFVFFHVEEF